MTTPTPSRTKEGGERVVLIQYGHNGKHPFHMVTVRQQPYGISMSYWDIDEAVHGGLARYCSGGGGGKPYIEGDGPYWAEKGYEPKNPGRAKTRRRPRGRYSPERILDTLEEVDELKVHVEEAEEPRPAPPVKKQPRAVKVRGWVLVQRTTGKPYRLRDRGVMIYPTKRAAQLSAFIGFIPRKLEATV